MRTAITSNTNPESAESALGSASLAGADGWLFTAGIIPERRGSLQSEAHQIYQTAASLLHEAGASLSDAVRVRLWHTEPGGEAALKRVHSVLFDDPGPALSIVRISGLHNNTKVAMEVEAVRDSAGRPRHHAPAEGEGWSRGLRLDDHVWISGITASGTDLEQQARSALRDVEDACEGLGVEPADIISTRHFIARSAHGQPLPAELPELMGHGEPTSAGITVEDTGAEDSLFAFECEAVSGASGEARRVRTGRTYEVENHYSRSVRVGGVTRVAGTTSIVVGEEVRHPGETRGQVFDSLETIRWAVDEQGMRPADIVQARAYVVGGSDALKEAAGALKEGLDDVEAAIALIAVPILGRPEVVVEIEATALAGYGR
ncbi:MAG: Rid family hydrolase [Chloroflexota bacterium]